MTNTNPDAALLRNLLDAYAVHGGDAAGSLELACTLRSAAVIALSILYVRNSKHAAYRIATLADGSRYLAVKYNRIGEGAAWLPVFAVARLERLVSEFGWTLRSEVA